MLSSLRPALVSLSLLTLLTGVAYPAVITAVGQLVFSKQANGSLLIQGDRAVGSRLIGQPFDDPRYFWGRLSATTPAYDASSSSGSNLGPTNPALLDAAKARIHALQAADPENRNLIPVDLVTASGSGLDPDESPAAALWQVTRVARARHLPEEQVRSLVEKHIEGRSLGFLGEPRVRVLTLNLALDELTRAPTP